MGKSSETIKKQQECEKEEEEEEDDIDIDVAICDKENAPKSNKLKNEELNEKEQENEEEEDSNEDDDLKECFVPRKKKRRSTPILENIVFNKELLVMSKVPILKKQKCESNTFLTNVPIFLNADQYEEIHESKAGDAKE